MALVFSEESVKRLPAPIVERLHGMIARIRRVLWWRGFWLTATATIGALLVVMAVDGAFDLESVPVRCALSLAACGFVVAVAWRYLVRPLTRSISLAAVARVVELRHPEMHERISTAVELVASDDPSSLRGSEELLGEVVKCAVADVDAVIPEVEVSGAPAVWPKRLAIAAAVSFGLVLALWPFHGGMLVARALLPFSNVGSASAFDLRVITGDATVVEGEPLTIRVAAKGRAARRLEIHRQGPGEPTVERLLPAITNQGEKGETTFALHVPAVRDGFRYHVTSGRARSRAFEISVLKRPDITGLSVTYTPPAYTGLESRTDPDSNGELIALRGTRIDVTARLSRAAVSAHLQYDLTENAGPPVEVGTELATGVPVARWSVVLAAATDYRWTLHPKGEHDTLGKPRSGVLRTTEDLTPAVVIDSPLDRDLTLRPNDTVSIIYTAADDFGFSSVELVVKTEGRDAQVVTAPLPTRDDRDRQTWHGTASLELTRLPLVGVREARVSLRVADTLPADLDGPQVAQSEEILIHFDWGAQTFARQTVNRQEEQIRAELEQIKTDLWDERRLADEKAREFEQPDPVRAAQFEELENLTRRAAESAEKIEATAAKMEKSAYAERAEWVEHASKAMVKPAAASLGEIPQFETARERSSGAARARDELEGAAKSIEEVLASLDQDQEQAQQTADLAALAEQQQQLADEAKAGARGRAGSQKVAAAPQPSTAVPPSAQSAPQPAVPQQAAPSEKLALEGRTQALEQWQGLQEFIASETGTYAGRFQKQSPTDQQSKLQNLADFARKLADDARELAQNQKAVESASMQSPQQPAIAAEAAERQSNVAAKAHGLRGTVENLSKQAGGALEQNGTGALNADKAATALASASETGRQAAEALGREAREPKPHDPLAKAAPPGLPDPGSSASSTPAQKAAAQTSQSLDGAAAALVEAAQALASQAAGIADASRALEAATQETELAAEAGQKARDAGEEAGRRAMRHAAESGQDPQNAHERAAATTQEQARAEHAAAPAQLAANNLARAAATVQAAMGIPKESLTSQNMGQHGSPKPGDGQSGETQNAENQNASQPGKSPSNSAALQTTKDYGLPPELAKLGMTNDDWARIRGLVQSGSDAAGGDRVPGEYRELVKGYFRALSAGSSPQPR